MTADSTSWVAESASSTIDPDVRTGLASDGERSAGFQSDVTIDEDGVDGLFTAAEFAAEFEENRDDGELYAEYRRLAERNPATSAGIAVRNVAMHLMPLVNGAQRLGIPRGKWHSLPPTRALAPGNSISRVPLRNKNAPPAAGILLAHRRQSPVVGRWVEPVESTIDFYRRNEREES
jgi:hypothetical protein